MRTARLDDLEISMDAKAAVKAAKRYVLDLFDDEELLNFGLEEIERNELDQSWNVTLGFSRDWQRNNVFGSLSGDPLRRDYRVVKVSDEDGTVISVKKLDVAA